MRVRRTFVTLVAAALFGTPLTACSALTGEDTPPLPTVANVQQESTQAMAQALARFGYQPIVPLYGKSGETKNKRTGTVYLVCKGKYEGRLSACADDYLRVASDKNPAIWVTDNKIQYLIGSRSTAFMDTRNLWVKVPATPTDPATSASATPSVPTPSASASRPPSVTWQDFIWLTPAQQTTLVSNVVPEAHRLCCSGSASASVQVKGVGQISVGWE